MPICKACGTEIIFVRKQINERTFTRAMPLDRAPNKAGNLVIDWNNQLYREATENEKEVARLYNKNLYISHYAVCPEAVKFRRRTGSKFSEETK